MTMTRQDVVSVVGSIDDVTIAEIIASGASLEELRKLGPGHGWQRKGTGTKREDAGRSCHSGRRA